MRMIGEIVCPGILLLGEVVMEPEKVVPYFGTVEKPECHMLYNVTTMATTWHTVATRDVSLLKKQLDIVDSLPKDYVFLNYLRCHDDIGWGLDYATLEQEGMMERSHKQYLNDYFQGYAGNSTSRGELYNADPVTGDARFCGTTASMCGIEKAGFEQDPAAMDLAIRKDLMLHAYMFMQSGIPVLYSGDEIAQVNDYTYKDDPNKVADSRYIHRGVMHWDLAEKRNDLSTVEGKMFLGLQKLEQIRKDMIELVIKPTVPAHLLDGETKIYVNPTGRFVNGGPAADTGLTGRKIIVDTYGGSAPHGGGAFSGKDPTKVDRSAAYAARWVAKNVVAAGLAKNCQVQLAYAIGVARPVSVLVETFGTGVVTDDKLEAAVEKVFDLRPTAIIRDLDLRKPIYRQLAAYGHMGREDLGVTWEKTDRVDALKAALGL